MLQKPSTNIGFNNLSSVKTVDLVNTFNLAFSDYFIKFELTESSLKTKLSSEKVDLNYSIGAFDNEKLVAFILHGVDIVDGEKILYNAGTGVIPSHRGNGLTKKMYKYLFKNLTKLEVNTILLEAISENIQATRSYQKVGFKINRELTCLSGKDIKIKEANKSISTKKVNDWDLSVFKNFMDFLPTWQNAFHILNQKNNVCLAAFQEETLVGYLIFNPKNNRINQIAVKKEFRRKKIASTLIHHFTENYGDTFSIINIDTQAKSILAFFEAIGLKETIGQVEMKLALN